MGNHKHLVVLIHGLWGSHNHMKPMEQVYREKLGISLDDKDNDDNDIIFFAPRQNALFKTFDGIEIIGYRTLIELCNFIKDFRDQNQRTQNKITRISIVGYSLGGLVARFIIGKCFTDCQEIFQDIEPFIFMTVASPHLGIQFYDTSNILRAWVANPVLRFMGSTFLGQSGRELFINQSGNKTPILVRLSGNEYLYGLSLFKHRIVMANVKNDRTVAFYTAFITDRDPFLTTHNTLKYFFESNIPMEDSYKSSILPRIVDLNKLDLKIKAPKRQESVSRKRLLILSILIPFAVIIFFPIALIMNTCGTIYSYLATSKYRQMLEEDRMPALVQEKIGIRQKVHEFVGNTYDSIINEDFSTDNYANANEQDLSPHTSRNMTSNHSKFNDSDTLDCISSSTDSNDHESWKQFIDKYSHNMDPNSPWLSKFERLPFDKNRETILKNLSTLEWIRMPIYVKYFNSHGGVIARRGLDEKTPPTGRAALELQANLFKHLIDTA